MTTGHAPSDSGEPTEPGTTSAPELPTFDVIPMRAEVRRAIDEMGWSNPTPVQIQAYPLAINGRDIIVQSRTGTGKTGRLRPAAGGPLDRRERWAAGAHPGAHA
jgi:superfamily II DNA/RNA helicase